jgi:hypothetical protein
MECRRLELPGDYVEVMADPQHLQSEPANDRISAYGQPLKPIQNIRLRVLQQAYARGNAAIANTTTKAMAPIVGVLLWIAYLRQPSGHDGRLRLNERPRKTLNFRCPADVFDETVALTR